MPRASKQPSSFKQSMTNHWTHLQTGARSSTRLLALQLAQGSAPALAASTSAAEAMIVDQDAVQEASSSKRVESRASSQKKSALGGLGAVFGKARDAVSRRRGSGKKFRPLKVDSVTVIHSSPAHPFRTRPPTSTSKSLSSEPTTLVRPSEEREYESETSSSVPSLTPSPVLAPVELPLADDLAGVLVAKSAAPSMNPVDEFTVEPEVTNALEPDRPSAIVEPKIESVHHLNVEHTIAPPIVDALVVIPNGEESTVAHITASVVEPVISPQGTATAAIIPTRPSDNVDLVAGEDGDTIRPDATALTYSAEPPLPVSPSQTALLKTDAVVVIAVDPENDDAAMEAVMDDTRTTNALPTGDLDTSTRGTKRAREDEEDEEMLTAKKLKIEVTETTSQETLESDTSTLAVDLALELMFTPPPPSPPEDQMHHHVTSNDHAAHISDVHPPTPGLDATPAGGNPGPSPIAGIKSVDVSIVPNVRGPCFECGEEDPPKWRKCKENGKDQCRRCHDKAYRERRLLENTTSGRASSKKAKRAFAKSSSKQDTTQDGDLELKKTESIAGAIIEASSRQKKKNPKRSGDFGLKQQDLTPPPMRDLASALGKRKSTRPQRYGGNGDGYGSDFWDELEAQSEDEKPTKKKRGDLEVGKKTHTSPRKRYVSTRDVSSNETGLRPQDTRCLAVSMVPFHEQRCTACAAKHFELDECRFKGIRWFKYDKVGDPGSITRESVEQGGESPKPPSTTMAKGGDTIQAVEGPFFHSSKAQDAELTWPSNWNIAFEPAHIGRLKLCLARALLPVLETESQHGGKEKVIRRPQEVEHRLTCDACMTSIFSGSWMCKLCGRELCFDCYDNLKSVSLRDSGCPPASRQNIGQLHLPASEPILLRCHVSRNQTRPHFFGDFVPTTRLDIQYLETIISEMKSLTSDEVPKYSSDPASGSVAPSLSLFFDEAKDVSQAASELAGAAPSTALNPDPARNLSNPASSSSSPDFTPPEDPSGVESLPIQYFHHTKLNEATFRDIWARGETMVVHGVLEKSQISWTPEYFKEMYGKNVCSIVNCDEDHARPIVSTVEEFFDHFGRYTGRNGVLKLKDWPSSTEFSEEFPELYEDFHRMVPIPNYTRRDGVLNIASHFPINAITPDIGPKMYNALESKELPGGHGSTRLHMDMADAVNIMLYAAPKDGKEGVAAWDIYPAADSDKIRQFLREEFAPEGKLHYDDPIHSQLFYLDSSLRKKLFERFAVKSWRIYQRAGEAVFIPAGCAHQVCNLADAIKVAVDFISPENIDRCVQLTKEFRAENTKRIWKEDVLALRTTMWHAWKSCSLIEEQLKNKGKGKESTA